MCNPIDVIVLVSKQLRMIDAIVMALRNIQHKQPFSLNLRQTLRKYIEPVGGSLGVPSRMIT